MSQEEDTYEQAIYYIRSSEHAEAIVRELAREGLRRPSDVLEEVKQQTGVTRSNFYDTLRRIEGVLVEKHDGPGRATLYRLTDPGERAAKEFGLISGSSEGEDAVTIRASDSLPEAFQKVMQVKRATVEDARFALNHIETENEIEGDEQQSATEENTTEHKVQNNYD